MLRWPRGRCHKKNRQTREWSFKWCIRWPEKFYPAVTLLAIMATPWVGLVWLQICRFDRLWHFALDQSSSPQSHSHLPRVFWDTRIRWLEYLRFIDDLGRQWVVPLFIYTIAVPQHVTASCSVRIRDRTALEPTHLDSWAFQIGRNMFALLNLANECGQIT